MKIEVLGPGCPNCKKTLSRTEEVIEELGIDAELEKIYDTDEITERGVMLTPALSVNGEVKVSGKVPSKQEIKDLLED